MWLQVLCLYVYVKRLCLYVVRSRHTCVRPDLRTARWFLSPSRRKYLVRPQRAFPDPPWVQSWGAVSIFFLFLVRFSLPLCVLELVLHRHPAHLDVPSGLPTGMRRSNRHGSRALCLCTTALSLFVQATLCLYASVVLPDELTRCLEDTLSPRLSVSVPRVEALDLLSSNCPPSCCFLLVLTIFPPFSLC